MMIMHVLFRRLDGLRAKCVWRPRRSAIETMSARRDASRAGRYHGGAYCASGTRLALSVVAMMVVATAAIAQPRYRLEFDTDPVVFDTYPPSSNITVSLTRYGRDPGDLSDELTVTLDRLHAQPGINAFDVPSGWTVTFPAHPTATAQTNEFIAIQSATPGTALLRATATNYVGDSAWVHVAPQIPLDQDSNADGIPDWWKMHFFGNLTAVGFGTVDGYTDYDGDGLNDYYEYLARTDPTDPADDAPWLDLDGDGLLNIEEQWLGTHPRRWDTDYDGIDDFSEVFQQDTDPVNSLDPLVWRSLQFGDAEAHVRFTDVYPEDKYAFTVSAWVKPADTDGGVLVQKRNAYGYLNFELGLTAGNHPYLAYHRTLSTNLVQLTLAGAGLPTDVWSYVTIVRDDAQSRGRVMAWNGATEEWRVHEASTALRPSTGGGWLTLGHDPNAYDGAMARTMLGELNEVRVWNTARPAFDVEADFNRIYWPNDVLALNALRAYYRFDDGGPKVENFAYSIRHGTHPRNRFFEGLKHLGTRVGAATIIESEIDALTDIDTNADGIPDWWYFLYGYDPDGPSIAWEDPDGDGVPNYWEYRLGSDPFDAYSLDPAEILDDGEWDSDGDGLSNWEEIHIYDTDPTRADTADNGIPDWHELFGDPTGTDNPDPQYITHPRFDMAYYHPTLTDELGHQFTPPRSLDLAVPAAGMGAGALPQ